MLLSQFRYSLRCKSYHSLNSRLFSQVDDFRENIMISSNENVGAELQPFQAIASIGIMLFFVLLQSRIFSINNSLQSLNELKSKYGKIRSELLSGEISLNELLQYEERIKNLEAKIENDRVIFKLNENVLFRLRFFDNDGSSKSDVDDKQENKIPQIGKILVSASLVIILSWLLFLLSDDPMKSSLLNPY